MALMSASRVNLLETFLKTLNNDGESFFFSVPNYRRKTSYLFQFIFLLRIYPKAFLRIIILLKEIWRETRFLMRNERISKAYICFVGVPFSEANDENDQIRSLDENEKRKNLILFESLFHFFLCFCDLCLYFQSLIHEATIFFSPDIIWFF